MTLDELMAIADCGYNKNGLSEGLILAYYDEPKKNHGDGLAKWIATELKETFADQACTDEQIAYAITKLEQGQQDIQNVIDQLHSVDANHKRGDA